MAHPRLWGFLFLYVGAEPELEIYDMAALVPIVEEAGGRFTSLEGKKGCVGRNALATNSHLHQRILAMLGGK